MKKLILILIVLTVIIAGIFSCNHFINKKETAIPENADSYKCKNMTLNYIPKGYKVTYEDSNSSVADLVFEKDSLYFTISLNHINVDKNVDTEDSTVENVYINKNQGVYIKKKANEEKILVWHYGKDYIFDITGNIPKEDMFKIAENADNPKL